MPDLILSSNRGTDHIRFKFAAHVERHKNLGIEADCSIKGEHFDGDHEHDINLSIEGLCFSVESLIFLQQKLNSWLELPLGQLDAIRLNGNHILSLFPEQRFDIAFGNRVDTIARPNPVVTVIFKVGLLHGEYYFVTDQSCLRNFSDSLGRALDTQY